MIRIDVLGTPAPKGSGRAMIRGGRAVHVPSGSDANRHALESWDVAVRLAALKVVGDRGPVFRDVPLALVVVFRMRRPRGHFHKKTGELLPKSPRMPITKPDSSKTLRSTEDSMTGIVYDDDSRIVETLLRKEYATGEKPEGATILIDEWRPTSSVTP